MHVVLLSMSLQPCAVQRKNKARSLMAWFCSCVKSELPARVRKRLPHCRSYRAFFLQDSQVTHILEPTAHKLIVQPTTCPAPDTHLSPCSHLDSPNPAPTQTLHRASSRGLLPGTQAAERSLDGRPTCMDAKEHLILMMGKR